MNSKERVRAALERRLPDRIPFGEFAIDFDTVERILGHETYVRAKAKCQIAFWEGRRDEVVQSWKEDGVELFRKLDCIDLVNLNAEAFGMAPPEGLSARSASQNRAMAPGRTGRAGSTGSPTSRATSPSCTIRWRERNAFLSMSSPWSRSILRPIPRCSRRSITSSRTWVRIGSSWDPQAIHRD